MKYCNEPPGLKPVPFNLYLKLVNEIRNMFIRMDIEADIHQFNSGYFEIQISLGDDFYASFSIREEIRLEFYHLEFNSGRYQMREQIVLDFDDLPAQLANILEPAEIPFTIYPDNITFDILEAIFAIQKGKEDLLANIIKAYTLQCTFKNVEPF